MDADKPLVQVRNLVKNFGALRALDAVSFDLHAGEVHGFIGPNGAGKTTAMRIMAGVEQPDSGDVFLAGESLVRHPELCRRLVGFMPDYLDSYPGISVWEYLDFYARIFGARPDARRRRLADVVEFTGLSERLEQPVEGLSKGWLQRLSLARVLMHDPKVLILDEPAAGLDPRARIELRDLVVKLARNGRAVFISSHILGELSEMCDAVTIIDEGRLRSSGGMDVLRQNVDGGNRVAVRLLDAGGGEARRLALFLAAVSGVTGSQETAEGAVFNHDGTAEFKVELLKRLIMDGFRITDFHSATSSLEEAFMAVTGGSGGEGK